MSTVPPSFSAPPNTIPSSAETPPSTVAPSRSSEIKLISHSTLFYWWPVWSLAFFMAMWTYFEGNRMAIIPGGADVTWDKEAHIATLRFPEKISASNSLNKAASTSEYNRTQGLKEASFKPRVSEATWPGAIFVVCLLVTIIVTNVPLRGLWSFLVIISVVVVALVLALLNVWDTIFEWLGYIHLHINMAVYMTIGLVMLVIWCLAVLIFDRKSYVIFTPGQIKVCEHIGAGVQAYPAQGVSLDKQRDDLFRHYIYGLGSGDLILKLPPGSDRREIRLPNVLFLGWRLARVEDIMRSVATT